MVNFKNINFRNINFKNIHLSYFRFSLEVLLTFSFNVIVIAFIINSVRFLRIINEVVLAIIGTFFAEFEVSISSTFFHTATVFIRLFYPFSLAVVHTN